MSDASEAGQETVTETLSPVLPTRIEERARDVMRTLCARGWRVAVAESCTGGLLASLLTDLAGASHAFDRGFVVYSIDAKVQMLGVARGLIEEHGAVSEPVARAMARAALDRSDAHVAVAITGFAGSAGPDDIPGLVHFAVATHEGVTHLRREYGDAGRGPVRIACLEEALRLVGAVLGA